MLWILECQVKCTLQMMTTRIPTCVRPTYDISDTISIARIGKHDICVVYHWGMDRRGMATKMDAPVDQHGHLGGLFPPPPGIQRKMAWENFPKNFARTIPPVYVRSIGDRVYRRALGAGLATYILVIGARYARPLNDLMYTTSSAYNIKYI